MAYSNPCSAYNHANKTKNHADQIVMLYASAISYVQQAKEAAEKEDHAKRYELIEKTTSIVRGLRACLDFSANDDVATALNNYYEALETLLVAAQGEDDKIDICDQIIENLFTIKKSWESINVYDASNTNSPEENNEDDEDDITPAPENYEPRDLHV